MCIISTPTPPDVKMPAERAQSRAPDGGAATSSAARRKNDQLRGATSTILTSGSGVSEQAQASGKTLLGQ